MCFRMRAECPCCRLFLHHCERCWDRFHNGERDGDYIEPKYFGEPMGGEVGEKAARKMEELTGRKPEVRPQKDRLYKEGDYGH